jgi:hypothetical protein
MNWWVTYALPSCRTGIKPIVLPSLISCRAYCRAAPFCVMVLCLTVSISTLFSTTQRAPHAEYADGLITVAAASPMAICSKKPLNIIHAHGLPLRDYHFVCVCARRGAPRRWCGGGLRICVFCRTPAKEAQQKLKTPRAFVWRLLVFVGCLLPLAPRRSICHEIILYGYARNLQS